MRLKSIEIKPRINPEAPLDRNLLNERIMIDYSIHPADGHILNIKMDAVYNL